MTFIKYVKKPKGKPMQTIFVHSDLCIKKNGEPKKTYLRESTNEKYYINK